VSLGAAAAATHVEASLQTEGAAPQPLQADVSADVPGRCIIISIVIPATAPVGSSVCFGPLTVSGQPVAGLLGALRVEVGGALALRTPALCSFILCLRHSLCSRPAPPTSRPSTRPGCNHSSPRRLQQPRRVGGGVPRHDPRLRRRSLPRAVRRACAPPRARPGPGGRLALRGLHGRGLHPWACAMLRRPLRLPLLADQLAGPPREARVQADGEDLYYHPSCSACFGDDLLICDNADTEAGSWTETGSYYAASASTGAHPMAQGHAEGWLAAEVVAWVV